MGKKPDNQVLMTALMQISCRNAVTMEDVEWNTENIIRHMDGAVAGCPGVDLVVFPECVFQGSPAVWSEVGLTMDSEPIRKVRDKCRELEIWGVFNPWIVDDGGLAIKNVAIVVNDRGEIVLEYTKMNPAIPFECTKPGNEMKVCDGPKGSRLAVIICSDILFPEIWREAASKGANVFIHISRWTAPNEEWLRLCDRTSALLNTVYNISVNSAGGNEAASLGGYSCVVDPWGRVMIEAPKGIPWIMYSSIFPSQADYMKSQSLINGENFLWSANHRGASNPLQKGFGLDYSAYSVYQKKE